MRMEKIVCHCLSVTIQDIADAIKNGAKNFEEVQEATGASTCCGRCEEYAQNVFQELLEESNA